MPSLLNLLIRCWNSKLMVSCLFCASAVMAFGSQAESRAAAQLLLSLPTTSQAPVMRSSLPTAPASSSSFAPPGVRISVPGGREAGGTRGSYRPARACRADSQPLTQASLLLTQESSAVKWCV